MHRQSSSSMNEENESQDVEVAGLEKWYNDYKAKISHEGGNVISYVQGKLKKLEDRNLKKQVAVDDPFLNQTVVNMALYDEELENYFLNEPKNNETKMDFSTKDFTRSSFSMSSMIDDREKSKKTLEPIKSFESVKNELKKQIFNQILLDKMTKETVKFDLFNGKTSDKIEDIMRITKDMKFTDLLNNFKCLQNDKNSNIIEYEFLFKRLAQSKQQPCKIFDFANYESRMKKISSDLILMEQILMEKFNELSDEINKKKSKMNAIRENIATLTGTSRRLQDEKEIIIKKLETIEEKLINTGSLGSASNIFGNTANFGKVGKALKKTHFNNISNADFLKLDRFRSERKQQESQLGTVIEKVQNDLKKDKMKMSHLDSEMKEMNFKKLSVRLHLREIYQKIFKSHDDFLQEEGLIWTIKSCWKIGENPPTNLFPKIIDETSVDFLLYYAKLDNDLSEQRKLVKEKKKEMAKYLIVDNHISSQSILQNTDYLKHKYEEFKKSLTSTHKKTLRREDEHNFFAKGNMKSYFQNMDENEEVKPSKKSNLEIEPSNKIITDLKNAIENAKLLEFNRIVKKYKELGMEKKIFEDFFLLLKYLFGKKEALKFYNNYLQLLNRKIDPLVLTLQDERNGVDKKENWAEKTKTNFEKLKNSVINTTTEIDLKNNFHFFKKSFKSTLYSDEKDDIKNKNFFRLRTE